MFCTDTEGSLILCLGLCNSFWHSNEFPCSFTTTSKSGVYCNYTFCYFQPASRSVFVCMYVDNHTHLRVIPIHMDHRTPNHLYHITTIQWGPGTRGNTQHTYTRSTYSHTTHLAWLAGVVNPNWLLTTKWTLPPTEKWGRLAIDSVSIMTPYMNSTQYVALKLHQLMQHYQCSDNSKIILIEQSIIRKYRTGNSVSEIFAAHESF